MNLVAAGLQPRARLPARRRPDRRARGLEDHRRPPQGDAHRRPHRRRLRLAADRLRRRARALRGAVFDGIWFAALGWLLASVRPRRAAQTAFTEQLEGDHGRRHHGRRAGDDPGRAARRARVRGVLPALPGLGLVRRRRGRRPLRRPRPPRGGGARGAARGRRDVPVRERRRPAPATRSPPTRRWRRCSARSRCAASARSWPSTPTAGCAASSRSSRSRARCGRGSRRRAPSDRQRPATASSDRAGSPRTRPWRARRDRRPPRRGARTSSSTHALQSTIGRSGRRASSIGGRLEAVDARHARVEHHHVRARARRAARAPPRRRRPRRRPRRRRPASATIVRIRKRTSAWSSTINGAHRIGAPCEVAQYAPTRPQ